MRAPPPYVPGHGLLTGKSVLITAAAGAGIGFSTAQKCIEEGCRAIVISDMHERRLAESVAKLKEIAGDRPVLGQLCDVTKEEQVQTLINFAEDQLGGVDVLINQAAGRDD
jgi:3-oxoacyl-[acyl-carrier protein] reductase